MDWSGCELIEIIPGKVSGVPLVIGTRIPADFVIESYGLTASIEDVLEEYPRLSRETILQLIQFAKVHHGTFAA